MTKVVDSCVIFHIIHDKQQNCGVELTYFLSILSWKDEQLCSFELKTGIVQRGYLVVGTSMFVIERFIVDAVFWQVEYQTPKSVLFRAPNITVSSLPLLIGRNSLSNPFSQESIHILIHLRTKCLEIPFVLLRSLSLRLQRLIILSLLLLKLLLPSKLRRLGFRQY